MSAHPNPTSVAVRALVPADLEEVVAIDAAIEGRKRRDYIERRLQAAFAWAHVFDPGGSGSHSACDATSNMPRAGVGASSRRHRPHTDAGTLLSLRQWPLLARRRA